MSKPTVLVSAPVATRSGYGARSRDVVRSLIELDRYDITINALPWGCLLYTSPSPRDRQKSRMPSSA